MATRAASLTVVDWRALTAADLLFVDSNVLIEASAPRAPLHAHADATLKHLSAVGVPLHVSRQVFREYTSGLTRLQPWGPALAIGTVAQNVRQLEKTTKVLEDGPAVTAGWLDLLFKVPCGGKQVHDANIVATMRVYGVPNLLTHNVADFVRFAGLITVVPLVP